jgi:hypothetical protein
LALLITLEAAYDITDTQELEAIGDCIRSALDELQGQGAARVSKAIPRS